MVADNQKEHMQLIEKFYKLAEQYGAAVDTEVAEDTSYIDCRISKENMRLYVVFVLFHHEYLAYSLNSDIAPSELYMEIDKDGLEARRNRDADIFNNTKRFLGKDLVYTKHPSFFNKERGYIEVNVEGKRLRLPQKSNIWKLQEISGDSYEN